MRTDYVVAFVNLYVVCAGLGYTDQLCVDTDDSITESDYSDYPSEDGGSIGSVNSITCSYQFTLFPFHRSKSC